MLPPHNHPTTTTTERVLLEQSMDIMNLVYCVNQSSGLKIHRKNRRKSPITEILLTLCEILFK